MSYSALRRDVYKLMMMMMTTMMIMIMTMMTMVTTMMTMMTMMMMILMMMRITQWNAYCVGANKTNKKKMALQ